MWRKLRDLFNNPNHKCLFHPDVTLDKLNAIIPMNTNPDPKVSLTFIRNLVMTADNETPIKNLLSHWLAINNYLMGLGHRQDLSAGNSQLLTDAVTLKCTFDNPGQKAWVIDQYNGAIVRNQLDNQLSFLKSGCEINRGIFF
jgi:hypothetical protein